MLTYLAGDPERPRGHALLVLRDADDPSAVWGTYLVVAPIAMDLTKYVPAAFATGLAEQLADQGAAAYPLPPVPEKIEGGLAWLEAMAQARGDDLLDGGTCRAGDPVQALAPVVHVGREYAERCQAYFRDLPTGEALDAPGVDVDDLLFQIMGDRERVERLARLVGTLRYAVEGGDERLARETGVDMGRLGRHLRETFRVADLVTAASSRGPHAADLAQLYIERCYRLADEDYAALADLDRRIMTFEAAGGDPD